MSQADLTWFVLLLAVVLVVAAFILWQEAKRRATAGEVTYVIEDAVDYISQALAGEDSGLGRADVKRIIEYEVFYLQGLAQAQRWKPVETVAGGYRPAVAYIAAEIDERHGVSYSPEQIEAVLILEAAYLHSIGAVGEPVETDETADSDER